MSAEAAYKVLQVRPGVPWEEIEQARRRLVQAAHPDNVAMLSPEKRRLAEEQAKRVNVAYLGLTRLNGN